MVSDSMKNLSAYVKYEDFLKLESAARDYEGYAIRKKARDGEYPLLIRLLFFTGARISEIVGSNQRIFTQCLYPGFKKRKGNCPKWAISRDDKTCIDSGCKYLAAYVQKAHHGIRVKDIVFKDRIIAVYGKNVKSDELKPRTVIVDTETLELLKMHIERYALRPNDKIISINENGAKVLINTLRDIVEMPWLSAHKFRHGHAIYCIQQGMDIRTLQQQLGHTDMGTTAIYLQFAIIDRQKAYDKVFGRKHDCMKLQCPACGLNFKVSKSGGVDLEDKIKTIFR
ncbi:MAG: site-specific integrase [Methanolobus sp.]|uniref:tyrosine-type recombinase/integrase n=1 Tax=Methanolobus sp. TaxID=1874737 RepID=UPI002731FE0B|nr:site-specific integrase [Methanolobus sp.]MDP2218169.1 site-specific integrase [Methanolobus sp.]